ncbi:MAG: TonB C-terminal domain-containing protein [Cyanobacteria bacterium HKST-UBA04]|nr:TonB C-terminal domain-containing protein [Cyanobacteria bacterium HKST-UBA04]MCA9840695.1 TonB C-terminal domain-containing protein [Cyanobacteria bacterium HKST-UBA03]
MSLNQPNQPKKKPSSFTIPRDVPELAPVTPSGPVKLLTPTKTMPMWLATLLSLGTHVLTPAFVALVLFILMFLGISFFTFNRPEPVRDIEFQLVEAPEEKPRDPNTRNRAERNTRAGGEKKLNLREAESETAAGSAAKKATNRPNVVQPKPQPRPQPQTVSQPKPQPRPQQAPKAVSKPTPKPAAQPQQTPVKTVTEPTPTPTPRPPRKVPTKKPTVSSIRPSTTRPSPLSPIQVPSGAAPVTTTGPVVKGGSSSSEADGAAIGSSGGPATLPGRFARPSAGGSAGGPSSSGSAGGQPGSGGTGAANRAGSPGGGGGRPGIDAVAEPNFGPYLAELQRRIRRNWHPPEERSSNVVMVVFNIGRDGRLLSQQIIRSSGSAQADSAARYAVERSAPFRPLPPEYTKSSISIEFTFDYKYMNSTMGAFRH